MVARKERKGRQLLETRESFLWTPEWFARVLVCGMFIVLVGEHCVFGCFKKQDSFRGRPENDYIPFGLVSHSPVVTLSTRSLPTRASIGKSQTHRQHRIDSKRAGGRSVGRTYLPLIYSFSLFGFPSVLDGPFPDHASDQARWEAGFSGVN